MSRPLWTVILLLVSVQSTYAGIVTFDGISTITTQGSPISVNLDGVPTTFTNKETVIETFKVGSDSYSPIMGFNRFDYTVKASANPTRVFYETGGTPLPGDVRVYDASPLATLEQMFANPLRINYGSDNTFERTLDSARFWTESFVEIINNAGLDDSGVVILERGANDNNFRVRAITGLDGDAHPDTYTDWFKIASGTDPFGKGVNYNLPHALYDSHNSDGTGPFVVPEELSRSQQIGAFMIPFADFGLSIGDRVFGYEIAIPSNGSRNGLDLLPGASAVTLNGLSTSPIQRTGESHLSFHANPEIPFANTFMALTFAGIIAYRNRSRSRLKLQNNQ